MRNEMETRQMDQIAVVESKLRFLADTFMDARRANLSDRGTDGLVGILTDCADKLNSLTATGEATAG